MPEIPIIILRCCTTSTLKTACGNCGKCGNSPDRAPGRPRHRCTRRTGRALAPDLLAASRESQRTPHRVDLVDHRLVHADLAAPLAVGLAGEFVGGVEADLGAETRH